MSNNNLTNERLSALIRVARDSLELYEMELPVIDDVMLALAELQQRRAAMLQGAEQPQNAQQNIPEIIPATQFKPVADLYEVTVPSGRSTTFTKDAAEASDCRVMGWSVQEYVKIERYQAVMLQGGNPPVIPNGWVACSELMPGIGTEIFYFCQDDGLRDCGIVSSSNFSGRGDAQLYVHAEGYDLRFGVDITHWMPLPAAPQQEEKKCLI